MTTLLWQNPNTGLKLLILAMLVAISSCRTCSPSGSSMITVTILPPETLHQNGSVGGAYTVGEGDIFRVKAKIVLSTGANFTAAGTGVSVIYVDPQTSRESSGMAALQAGSTTDYYFDLPGSNNLTVCQPMFYRVSAVYDLVPGERGVYLGEPQYVLPSQYHPTPTSIQQALCTTPTRTPWD